MVKPQTNNDRPFTTITQVLSPYELNYALGMS